MTALRAPAVAGTFYPDDPITLAEQVDRFIAAAKPRSSDARPKALIAPHAGYVYSGPVAGSAYAALAARASTIERVLLLGPAHHVRLLGMAAPSVDGFATPLGVVPIDEAARLRALELPGVVVDDSAHEHEHSLEVHLPFLQRTLGDFRVLPVVVGRADHTMVAALLDALWGGPETLIVVSSDLSHYENIREARLHDRDTAAKILDGRGRDVSPYDACGCYPVHGLLDAAQRHHLHSQLLDLRTSGDTAGPPDRVVGYGAFVFTERQDEGLPNIAVDAIRHALLTGERREPDPADLPLRLQERVATFVTLEDAGGNLLGCIGSLEPRRALGVDIAHNALAAAFDDPRLPPLTADQFPSMTVHVSVLSPLEPVPVDGIDDLLLRLRPGVDGLLIDAGAHTATFLPAVWEKVDDAGEFVDLLWRKAGLSPRSWPAGMRVHRYTTETAESVGPRPALR